LGAQSSDYCSNEAVDGAGVSAVAHLVFGGELPVEFVNIGRLQIGP
jgi:hypothetical protein